MKYVRDLLMWVLVSALVGSATAETLFFDFVLDGNQEVPAVSTAGQGRVHVELIREGQGTVAVHGTYENLSTEATGAGIFGDAAFGQNGGLLLALDVTGGTSGMLTGTGMISDVDADAMRHGMTYLNVSSTQYPDGEIRGQIVPRVPGDLNCDGQVDFADINLFVLALGNPAGYEAAFPGCNLLNADINGDGMIDFVDINPFVELLSH